MEPLYKVTAPLGFTAYSDEIEGDILSRILVAESSRLQHQTIQPLWAILKEHIDEYYRPFRRVARNRSWSVDLSAGLCGGSRGEPSRDHRAAADIGSRVELFVDDYLIESMDGILLKLQQPRSAGKVLSFDRSWEGNTSYYPQPVPGW